MNLTRNWRRFFLISAALFPMAAFVAVFLPAYTNLIFLFLYSIPGNSFIPIPHEPGMIFFGQFYPPALVAIVAAVATLIPCFLDYQFITFAFQARQFRKIRESDVYQGAVHYFLKAPFVCILLAACVPPIPFYIFRVLSPTSGYPLRRYMLAVFLGRLPRYYFFALMGSALSPPGLILAGGCLLLLCALLCSRVKRHLATRERVVPIPVETGPSESPVPNLSLTKTLP